MASLTRGFSRVLRPVNARILVRCFAAEAGAGGNDMNFTFGSPSATYYTGSSVKQVDVPTTTGVFGILPSHVPTVQTLKAGVVSVFDDSGVVNKYFVSSGSVSVHKDSSVHVLCEEAFPLEELDTQAARKGLEESQSKLVSAVTDLEKAEASITVEFYESLVKALE